ncbi:MAG: c-type cytochrome [Gemmataceae bacterium]|nr:c-type cytochrome [Gemmataceae bacterium]
MIRYLPFLLVPVAFAAAPPTKQYRPDVKPASGEAAAFAKRIRIPKGMELSLWAAEPMLAHPVAFALDHRNRVYVAESFRIKNGVDDIRGFLDPKKDYWLDDDLACRTVADRIAMTRKHLGKRAGSWARASERLRLLEDVGETGKATRSTVFADGFSRLEDGIAAGVLPRGDAVYFACIPDLVLLRDPKGIGHATERKVLSTGYGVRMGFYGHDLHGLIMGMDGRIYFSIGDRGLNVVTKEGKRLEYPDTGAVLRCEPDGSNLEVFATGLRNPQELAFDKFGNLFTGDNNCDAGDRARWVYLMQGGDCGWRIGYQFDGSQGPRGPWMAEKLWHPPHAGQPAWIVPPVANIADGPSGLAYYPGVGLSAKYDHHFFLADFRGNPTNSGIRSFSVKPKGAGFELIDSEQFIWGVLATDVAFRTDGSIMVSDWIDGWGLTGKGRLWTVTGKESKSLEAQDAKLILAYGFTKLGGAALGGLLGHVDQRLRLEAHLELASRGKNGRAMLAKVLEVGENQVARLHAIWGLGIQGRKDKAALAPVRKLLEDADAEVRAQACKVLADAGEKVPASMLKDESVRVRSLAAGVVDDVAALAALLAQNADEDPWLRHAAVMGLARFGDEKKLAALASHASAAVRRGALLALRRQGSASVARFLSDAEADIVTEATRAINDAPIDKAASALAALVERRGLPEPAMYRALNAAYRLGTKDHADAVAKVAARADVLPKLRIEALRMLESWAKPGGRDRVMGVWRPLKERPAEIAAAALRDRLGGVFSSPDDVRKEAAKVAATLGVKEVGAALLALLKDAKAAPLARAESLRAMASLKDKQVAEAVKLALGTDVPAVRAAGREVLARTNPEEGLKELAAALKEGTVEEKQSAYAVLGTMNQAEKLLGAEAERLATLDASLRLDLIAAAEKFPALKGKLDAFEKTRGKDEPFGSWRYSLQGGDAARGKEVFLNKAAVSCLRCHKAEGMGSGEVGPDLTGIGAKQKREYLLESIVFPSKQIAKGYETVDLRMKSGVIRSGILKSETETTLTIMSPEGALSTIRKDRIESRTAGKSAMPDDLVKHLTRQEVRDLVEYLASLKTEPKK